MSDFTIEITLSWPEVMEAAMVGMMRRIQNLRWNTKDKHGADRADSWGNEIESSCAEKGLAKHLNIYWSGAIGNTKAADVAEYQVRSTTRDNGRLILHPDDNGEQIWVLVTGVAPKLCLRGWVYGHEGKKQEYWEDPKGNRPAFFVPQKILRSMSSLPDLKEQKKEAA